MIELFTNRDRAVDILARTLWGEARGEGRFGMMAVACVVLNRVKRARAMGGQYWWGHTIEAVCLKPWQFSCWNHNDPNRKKLEAVTLADTHFQEAHVIAVEAINGQLLDMTGGADHYHTRAIMPRWARGKTPTVALGHHLFYKLEG